MPKSCLKCIDNFLHVHAMQEGPVIADPYSLFTPFPCYSGNFSILCGVYLSKYLQIIVNVYIVMLQVRIPSAATTYWCKTQRLPQHVINQTHYITSVSIE